MEKLKLHTSDLAAENIKKLAEVFPSCVTETRDEKGNLAHSVDFDQLRQELSDHMVEGPRERYHLDWPGKREAILAANAPIAKTLRPCREESVNFDTTKNLFIEGDNLDALKLLQEVYLNKVKMIYIDPPYNTGSDLIYHDDFAQDVLTYLERSNQSDELGNRMMVNNETNGRFHSDWITMLYSRLRLARNLLREDGVIFMSIGDQELHNARAIMTEVFGEQNYVNTVCIKAKPSAGASGGGEDKRLKKNMEFLLIYCKNRDTEGALDLDQAFDEVELSEHISRMREAGTSWKYTRAVVDFGVRKSVSSFVDGEGNEIAIFHHTGYRFATIAELSKKDETEMQVYNRHFDSVFRDTNAQSSIRTRVAEALGTEDGLFSIDYSPRSGRSKGKLLTVYYKGPKKDQIAWLRDIARQTEGQIVIRGKTGTLWADFNWNNVSKEGDLIFPNGKKPIALIQRMLKLATRPEESNVVVDFFAGSGTTAHAVVAQNAEDQGNRRFLLVQVPETVKRELGEETEFETISKLGMERVRRAGSKLKAETALTYPGLDEGFRVLKIDASNMKDVYSKPDESKQVELVKQIDNIREDRTPEDLLFQVLVDWGVDLTLSIVKETVGNRTVFLVDGNALCACFDDVSDELVTEIAKRKPLRAVFRDKSYSSDSVKINVEQIFKLLSPSTEIRSI
jgi:adenine-specific DNA-methyltransferase